MTTVKELKDFLENIPDDTILISKFYTDTNIENGVFACGIDIGEALMRRDQEHPFIWYFDPNGCHCIVFY